MSAVERLDSRRCRPDRLVSRSQRRREWFVAARCRRRSCATWPSPTWLGDRLGPDASSALTGLLGALSAAGIVSLGLQLCIANLQSRSWRGDAGLGRFGPGAVVARLPRRDHRGCSPRRHWSMLTSASAFVPALSSRPRPRRWPLRSRRAAGCSPGSTGSASVGSLLAGSAVRLGLAVVARPRGRVLRRGGGVPDRRDLRRPGWRCGSADRTTPQAAAGVAMRCATSSSPSSPHAVSWSCWSCRASRREAGSAARCRPSSHAAQVGRMVFFAAFGVAFLHFPAIVAAPIGSDELRRVFHRAVLWTSVTAIAAAPSSASPPSSSCAWSVAEDEVDLQQLGAAPGDQLPGSRASPWSPSRSTSRTAPGWRGRHGSAPGR